MSFIKSRLRRVESTVRNSSGCPECGLPPDAPGRIVYSDSTGIGLGAGLPENSEERCKGCGRRLWLVIEVVYEGEG